MPWMGCPSNMKCGLQETGFSLSLLNDFAPSYQDDMTMWTYSMSPGRAVLMHSMWPRFPTSLAYRMMAISSGSLICRGVAWKGGSNKSEGG